MKKLLTALLLISAISTMGQSGLLGSLKKSIGGTSGSSSSLSSTDIVAGLKQALELGAEKSADRLSAANGFLGDKAVKILMPEQA